MPEAVQRYRLCETCLRRQGAKSPELELGKADECFICGGLFADAASTAKRVAKSARSYEFQTFSIGLSMPDGVQEREDEIRSSLRMMGGETVKVQLARMLTEAVAGQLRKRIEKGAPDLTALVDLQNSQVAISSRPLFLYARYTKPAGVPQRREWCTSCRGKGCEVCKQTGYEKGPSVEGLVAAKLSKTGSDNMKFTWMGSEDVDSFVMPPGRPFVVEVKNPVKRRVPKRFYLRSRRGKLTVSGVKILPSRPVRLPSFRFRTKIDARAAVKVDRGTLRELERRFSNAQVRFDRPHDRSTVKNVYRLRAKADGKKLTMIAELDGGLPVKRLVGGELVSPSVSEVLKTEVRCRSFDIIRVVETGEFEFAKVSRLQKKNKVPSKVP